MGEEYYRWESEIRTWRGRTLQAKLKPFAKDWFRIDLRSSSPIAVPLPVIEFDYPAKAPRPDLIFSGSEWEPYSSRIRALLRSEGVVFEEFPCRLIDVRSGRLLSEDYAVVHLLDCYDCFDWEKSTYTRSRDSDGQPVALDIKELALKDPCRVATYPLFRLETAKTVVLVHSRLRRILEDQGITGVRYFPLRDDKGF